MFSKGGMNDSAVEKDFGSVRNAIELLQGFIELVIVVVVECCHPGLDFLFWYEHPTLKFPVITSTHLLQRHYQVVFVMVPCPEVVPRCAITGRFSSDQPSIVVKLKLMRGVA